MNGRMKRIAAIVAGGVAATLLLTACNNLVNNRQVVSGPNGLTMQAESISLEKAAPANQTFNSMQEEKPQVEPVIAVPQTPVEEKVKEKPAVVVPPQNTQTAKSAEQVKSAEQATAQMAYHHCAGYDD